MASVIACGQTPRAERVSTSGAAEASPERSAERVEPMVAHVNWATVYATVNDIRRSDVVLHGRVTSVLEEGIISGDPAKDAAIQFRELQVASIRVLAGTPQASYRVLQEGYDLFPPGSVPEGSPTRSAYSPDGMRWAYEGDEVLLFLKHSQDAKSEVFTIPNSQSLFFVEDGVLVSAVRGSDDLVINEIVGRSPGEFERLVGLRVSAR